MEKVYCIICNKEEVVKPSRLMTYKTCSKECLGVYKKGKNNVSCFICNSEFHIKPYRLNQIKNEFGITCSKRCSNKLKENMYKGRKNPNTKYRNLDDDFFKNLDDEGKSYLLGWIASDGHVNKDSVVISIDKKDVDCLKMLRNIICKDLVISNNGDMVYLRISSKTISEDICSRLNIRPGKKSHTVKFPNLESQELKLSFIRGFFDGDGSIHNIDESHTSPYCKITTSSDSMRESILEVINTPCNNCGTDIAWSGNNALDFLERIYNNSKYRLDRKYNQYLDISTWVPSISYSRYYKNDHCSWSKTRKDAVSPFKVRASDSGYDLTLLEKIKTVGDVEFYDTGIKVKPKYGYYFQLVPRSSISKTGYMLANSIGIIDRTYLGNIIVPLIKVDKSAKDLELPLRIVQIIPTHIVHFEFVEVDNIEEETERGTGGFGSTN